MWAVMSDNYHNISNYHVSNMYSPQNRCYHILLCISYNIEIYLIVYITEAVLNFIFGRDYLLKHCWCQGGSSRQHNMWSPLRSLKMPEEQLDLTTISPRGLHSKWCEILMEKGGFTGKIFIVFVM